MANCENLTIAIVDSGVGGVSVLRQLINKYNAGNYIYFADNLNMPYGNKSSEWLKRRIKNIVDWLFSYYKVDLVIIACNTASTVTENTPNVITMTFDDNYTYLATKLTKKNLPNLDIVEDNSLAKAIEMNILDKKKLKQVIQKHIKRYSLQKYPCLVLGCTHYELVISDFQKLCPSTRFINNSTFVIDNINLPPDKSEEVNIIIELSKKDLSLENKINKLIRS